MTTSKADILARLQKEILPLQGIKSSLRNTALDAKLGTIKNAFPAMCFPVGAIHEFINSSAEDATVTGGFVMALLSSLMQNAGIAIWIRPSQTIFPPALKAFGIVPDKLIFIELKKEKEIVWAMEEALKCDRLSAVIADIRELDFTVSRRLQLAVEQSRVTGFILRNNPRTVNTTACVARWKITSLPSALETGMPGVGFPRWNVELLKVRNGKPGSWQVELNEGRFQQLYKTISIGHQPKKKTG